MYFYAAVLPNFLPVCPLVIRTVNDAACCAASSKTDVQYFGVGSRRFHFLVIMVIQTTVVGAVQ